MTSRIATCLAAFIFCFASVVEGAAQKVWTGTTNNHWSVSTNWTGGVPANTDIAIFPADAANKDIDNDVSGVTLTSIDFQGGSYTIGGNSIAVLGGISSASGTGSTPNTFNVIVTASGTQQFQSTSGNLVFHNGISLATGVTLTFNGTAVQQVLAGIVGDGNIIKNGTGNVLFNTANSYTGTTTINGGYLNVVNALGLGSASGGTTVNAGGCLHPAFSGSSDEPLTLSGLGPDGSAGAFYADATPSVTFNGTVAISGTTRIRVLTDGNMTLNGVMSGTGALEFVGGTFTLGNGSNSFNANVKIVAPGGTVRVGADHAIPSTTTIILPSASATFDLNNHATTIDGIEGVNGTVQLGTGVLTITPLHFHQFIGSVVGGGGITVHENPMGYSEQDFFQSNPGEGGPISITGQIDVMNGPYFSINNGTVGNIVVQNGSTLGLGSSVTTGNIVATSGAIWPGWPGGPDANCNSLLLDAASEFSPMLRSTFEGLHSTVYANGTITLGGARFVWKSYEAVTPPIPAQSFTIIKNNGASPVNGTFANWPDNTVKVLDTRHLRMTYTGNGANDVVVTQLAARGDASADLKGDILWRNSSTGDNSQWIMNGATIAVSSSLPPVADTNWVVAGIGDFDRDGRADYLWHNNSTGGNVIWFMGGASIATTAVLPEVPDTNWKIVGVGDFDGDYKADVMWRNSVSGNDVLWLMDGATIASSAVLPMVADPNFRVAALGDLQGDGRVDVVWRNIATGTNVAWLMNGGTVMSSAILTPVADTNWKIAGMGDFQADGKADIVWHNTASGANSVWLMNGFNVAVSAGLGTVADTNWVIAKVEDLQGDGKADLVWHNVATGTNSVWFINGTVAAVTAALTTVPDTNWSPAGPP